MGGMKREFHDKLSDLSHTVANAAALGAERVAVNRFALDIAGKCTHPKGVQLYERPSAFVGGHVNIVPGGRIPIGIDYTVRCRQCDECNRARHRLWRDRARSETKAGVRTWFGTLTIAPSEQHRFLVSAQQRQARRGGDFDALDHGAQFRLRVAEAGRDIQKYLKRVRKESRAPLRYILVAEAHLSGLPHFHILVHERALDRPVRQHTLRDQWCLGFSRWKLVSDVAQVTYVTKYISKSAAARVRASQRYGTAVSLSSIAVSVGERPPQTNLLSGN